MLFLKSTLMSTVKLSDVSTALKIKLCGHFSTCYSAFSEGNLQLVDAHMHAQIHTNIHVLTHINAKATGGSAEGRDTHTPPWEVVGEFVHLVAREDSNIWCTTR